MTPSAPFSPDRDVIASVILLGLSNSEIPLNIRAIRACASARFGHLSVIPCPVMNHITPAHDQSFTHSYVVVYPEHGPRESDPYYADFHAYKTRRRANGTYVCDFATNHRHGDTSECSPPSVPLECHHSHIEFATMNAVDMELLETDYPGVSKMGIGKWVESAANLELLCVVHHRTDSGVHKISYSDFGAGFYIRRLFRKAP